MRKLAVIVLSVMAMSLLAGAGVFAANGQEDVSPKEEIGDNMAQATINGENIIFYLIDTSSAYDGEEARYMSFSMDGSPQYYMYLRIALNSEAGTVFKNDSGEACYISMSTSYDAYTDTWSDSYCASKSKHPEENGSYNISIDYSTTYGGDQQRGTFEATLLGSRFSTDAVYGKELSVTDGTFCYSKNATHNKIQEWQEQNRITPKNADNSIVSDDLNSNEIIDDHAKDVCVRCNGSGRVSCSACDGSGTVTRYKSSINLGSGSKTYKVKETCKACHGSKYLDCPHCGGSGYEY